LGSAFRRYWIRWPGHLVRRGRIDLGERLDARERVVEEVRLDLGLQRRELGLGHLLAHAVVLGLLALHLGQRLSGARAVDEELDHDRHDEERDQDESSAAPMPMR
jgi:hypothetical protein